jgi:hypothetical protein
MDLDRSHSELSERVALMKTSFGTDIGKMIYFSQMSQEYAKVTTLS